MKKTIAVILAVLMTALFAACGGDNNIAETVESTSQAIENIPKQEVEYRDFNLSDFTSLVPYSVCFYSSGQGVVDEQYNIRHVFKDGILNNLTYEDTAQHLFVEKFFPQYVFGIDDSDCVTLEYLGEYYGEYKGERTQKTFSYYKVTINKPSKLQEQYNTWNSDDEVYMMVQPSSKNTSNELEFFYYIRNYSQGNTLVSDRYTAEVEQNDGKAIGNDATYADWNTYCTENTISTELYDLTIPDSWLNTCAYDIAENGWDITFTLPSRHGGDSDCTLLELRLIWGDYTLENLPAGNWEYLGVVGAQNVAYLVAVYPFDLPDNEQAASIPQVLSSVTPKEYVTYKKNAYPVSLPDYYCADGFNEADSLFVSDYLCGCSFVGLDLDTTILVEKNPYGDFFNIDVGGIGYFNVERCTIDFESSTLTYKLYCGDYYAEVICRSGGDCLIVNVIDGDTYVVSDRFYLYTP